MSTTGHVTTFLAQNTTSTLAPFDDCQRVYSDEHDPVVYGCTNEPGKRSFQILDLPQRRWYEVNWPSSTWPTPPLSEEEERSVEKFAAQHIASQSKAFNTINMDKDGNTTYEMKPFVGIPLRKQPVVSDCAFPTASYADITQKKYAFRAVDTCVWNRISCIYKQVEFDDLIPQMQREITSRESLICHFNGSCPTFLSTLGVTPILAVVVHGDPPLLYGILVLNAGLTFESASNGQIKVQHLVSLMRTVKYLLSANVVHGDICERNVCVDGSSLQLIDFGEVAPGYKGDVVASGELLLWCAKRMTLPSEERDRILRAGRELVEGGNPDAALMLLKEGRSEVSDC